MKDVSFIVVSNCTFGPTALKRSFDTLKEAAEFIGSNWHVCSIVKLEDGKLEEVNYESRTMWSGIKKQIEDIAPKVGSKEAADSLVLAFSWLHARLEVVELKLDKVKTE